MPTFIKTLLLSFLLAAFSSAVAQYDDEEQEEQKPTETRIRFKNFTVLFHDFKGYTVYEGNEATSFGDSDYYFGGGNSMGAILNYREQYDSNGNYNDSYVETLVAHADTVQLYEDLDQRINNTLIQILPNNKKDVFRVSFCYTDAFSEVFDYRKYTNEQLDAMYQNNLLIKGTTPYYPIKDSAKYYFRAFPHMPDMVQIDVIDGKIAPVNPPNTPEQLTLEQKLWEENLARIKKKYQLQDTLIIIPGEYDTVIDLTNKEGRLFGYGFEAFLFRIECLAGNKVKETKYVLVYIQYGC